MMFQICQKINKSSKSSNIKQTNLLRSVILSSSRSFSSTNGEDRLFFPERPRRNRKSATIRNFTAETWLAKEHFVYPMFIHDTTDTVEIASMPGQYRYGIEEMLRRVESTREGGVMSCVLFPSIVDSLKTPDGKECFNPEGLIPTAIRAIKQHFPDMTVVTDVALDPYNSDGHDGIVAKEGRRAGEVMNDTTVQILCKQALCQAEAGADIIAPSDMMDGRVAAIRDTLDTHSFDDVSILSYTAKYASAYYGPFRDALNSAPKFGDKKTYQMQYTNVREAIREVSLDEEEGADIIMVKPAGAYLDIIKTVRASTTLPVAAYQVSGEYSMIKAAVERGWLDERAVALESLYAIRRAGADLIFTYYANDAARWLREERG